MIMKKFTKLTETNQPTAYALMQIQNVTKLACNVSGEWIIDSTCKAINEMLEVGLISEAAVTGWISNQTSSNLH